MRFKFTFSGTEESTYNNETEVIHVLCLKKKKNKAKFQQFFFQKWWFHSLESQCKGYVYQEPWGLLTWFRLSYKVENLNF